MVGGAKDCYERAVPLLDCMGRAAVHCGAHGSGQAAKVCNNMLLAASMIATSEALQLGIKYISMWYKSNHSTISCCVAWDWIQRHSVASST